MPKKTICERQATKNKFTEKPSKIHQKALDQGLLGSCSKVFHSLHVSFCGFSASCNEELADNLASDTTWAVDSWIRKGPSPWPVVQT